jgi:hypothetical protein
MGSSKLEAIGRLFELFNRLPTDPERRATSSDIEEMLDLFHLDSEWVPPPTAPGPRTLSRTRGASTVLARLALGLAGAPFRPRTDARERRPSAGALAQPSARA